MTRPVPVVAIDGPSGAGKGTVSRTVAGRMGWHWLDSGALYRLVGLMALRRRVPLDDPDALAELAAGLRPRFAWIGGREQVLIDGEDVAADLRTEASGSAASRVAQLPGVRAALLERQRAFALPPGLVADGRDMGTVVFPDATLKVFLTASVEERARRRYKQLKEKGIDVSLRDLSGDIAQRDQRDSNRAVAPLRPADDARVIDSTSLSPERVADQIVDWLEQSGAGGERT